MLRSSVPDLKSEGAGGMGMGERGEKNFSEFPKVRRGKTLMLPMGIFWNNPFAESLCNIYL